MLNGSPVSFDIEANTTDCAFCHPSEFSANIIKETPSFLLVADHAPLVEGHLLIITKQHYTCYGAVPTKLDGELLALKRVVQQFLARFYAPVVYWEHGIFKQTVFHAHLHCFPFGATGYELSEKLHSAIVHSQEDIRTWYITRGQYFYMEDAKTALLFAPEMDRYLQIIKDVFRRGIASRGGSISWRSPQQRYDEGGPLIEAMAAKWRIFEQQGVDYAHEASTG